MPSQPGDLCIVLCPVLPVPDKLAKSQLVSQGLWDVFQVAGINCAFPDDSCSNVTGEQSQKHKRFCSPFFLHVSDSGSGGQEEEGREKKKEEVGSREGGKENTTKVEDRLTPLRNISKKTAKRILELVSDESVRDAVAPALIREQACCPLVAPACSGSLLSFPSRGGGFCRRCLAVVRELPQGPGEDPRIFPLCVPHM